MLIRTGKPKIYSIYKFTENCSPIERDAQEKLASIVGDVGTARNVVNALYDCPRHLDDNALWRYVVTNRKKLNA
jgi:hypothetical protein